jgi:membrane protein DedA with SNARE-associated domain
VSAALLASITTLIENHGMWAYVLLFAIVACGVLAAQGSLSIVAVIAVASAAAIIGDNLGYVVARRGGRKLLFHYRVTRRYAERYLPLGERFFEKHGGKAVFFARFVSVLRVTAAWTAGLTRMSWWRFFAWNAAGGIVWAMLFGLIAYFLGDAAAKAIGRYGLYAAGGVLVLAALGYLVVKRLERRVVREDRAE